MQKKIAKIVSVKEHVCVDTRQTSCAFIRKKIEEALIRFPKKLDSALYKVFDRLLANTSSNFISQRSFSHLRKILLVQFFQEKWMEKSTHTGHLINRPIFIKIFQQSSSISLNLSIPSSYGATKDQISDALLNFLPSALEIPSSSFCWYSPELSYIFFYLEFQRLRGHKLTAAKIRDLEKNLTELLITTPSQTQALFCPCNEEDAYRQLHSLESQIIDSNDLPQVSVHFQEQMPNFLRFLVNIARPKALTTLVSNLKILRGSMHYSCYFYVEKQTSFPIECGSFSFKIPSALFIYYGSINLLHARRYLSKCLEKTIGPFRDFNGGLFEKYQDHFNNLKSQLSDHIPYFELFAEKLFYALKPLEIRLTLSFETAKNLFEGFSKSLEKTGPYTEFYYANQILIIKTVSESNLTAWIEKTLESPIQIPSAELFLGGFYYLCLLDFRNLQITSSHSEISDCPKTPKILNLVFQEGPPPSLNPYYGQGDLRSRFLSNLLYEGLVKIDSQGIPKLAGASSYVVSNNGSTYIFVIRPSHWSNGEKVTAANYVNSLKHAIIDNVSHPEVFYIIKNVKKAKTTQIPTDLGIKALGNDVLQFDLEYPDPNFFKNLAQPFFFPTFSPSKEPQYFNGPYHVTEKHSDGLLVKPNPFFNGSSNLFSKINIKWEYEEERIFELFNQEKVDWVGEPFTTISTHNISRLDQVKKLQKHISNRYFLLYFNTTHPLLASPSIRQALSLAIDRSVICNSIYPYSIPTTISSLSKKIANALFEKGLKELGLARDSFSSLCFSYSHQPRRNRLARFLQTTWQEILEISVNIEETEWNYFRNNLERKNFQIIGTIQDIDDFKSLSFLDRFYRNDSWNFSQWHNDHYNDLVDQIRIETDENKRNQLIRMATIVLENNTPFTSLFKYTHLYAVTKKIGDYRIDEEGCIDF